jgi:hypothetical protein
MRFKRLRIAWSVFWGVTSVLLIVLWVRSYRYWDFGGMQNGLLQHWTNRFDSITGILHLEHSAVPKMASAVKAKTGYRYEWMFFTLESPSPAATRSLQRLSLMVTSARQEVIFPYWCLTLVCGIIGGAPLIRCKWRFSLRTLLIATTFIALALGTIVWLAHW